LIEGANVTVGLTSLLLLFSSDKLVNPTVTLAPWMFPTNVWKLRIKVGNRLTQIYLESGRESGVCNSR